MPTPAEHLDLGYPGLAEAAGDAATAWAISVAEAYRPGCLPTDRQDLAQAYYAAFLLMGRTASAQTVAGQPSRPSLILEEKEGDNSVKYADPGVAGGYPTAYEAWKRLSDICSRGAITTRFGSCLPLCG